MFVCLCANMSLVMWVLGEATRGYQMPWSLSYRRLWVLETKLDPLEDQQVLLTTEISFQVPT